MMRAPATAYAYPKFVPGSFAEPPRAWFENQQRSFVPHSPENKTGDSMGMSLGKSSLKIQGHESPNSSVTTDNLVDFCSAFARKHPIKRTQAATGLSKKQVENIRQGLSGVSGTTLTRWIMGDIEFMAEYLEWTGTILPGDGDKAKALTLLVNAHVRGGG